MEWFADQFTNKIDRKGRVSVPADFRQVLAARNGGIAPSGLYIFPDRNEPCINGASDDYFDGFMKNFEAGDLSDPSKKIEIRNLMKHRKRLSFQDEVRVVLPPEWLSQLGITDEALFVGTGFIFQIWNPKTWAEFEAQREAEEDGGLFGGFGLGQGGAA